MLDGSISVSSAHVGTAECGFGDDVACNWRQAHAALQQIARKRAVLDVEQAHWLVIAKRTRVHVELGFATFLEYMERILGYGYMGSGKTGSLQTLPEQFSGIAVPLFMSPV